MKIPKLTSVKPTDRKMKKAKQAAKEIAQIVFPKSIPTKTKVNTTPLDSFAYINKSIPLQKMDLKK